MDSTRTDDRRAGLLIAWGIALATGFAYFILLRNGRFDRPFLPAAGSLIALILAIRAWRRGRTVMRVLSTILFVAALLMNSLGFVLTVPKYDGPVTSGRPLPEEFLRLAGMTDASMKPSSRLYVFFRGRW